MMQLPIPPHLAMRMKQLGVQFNSLRINIPPGTNCTPQEIISQLDLFIADIESGRNKPEIIAR